ncbi:MAG: hypothetical protein NT120_04765 [Candidatus Aenigmarchaeota archaeon]|nr:hypothetical protein [Candidatus Aenigmarchaeota archaeon]
MIEYITGRIVDSVTHIDLYGLILPLLVYTLLLAAFGIFIWHFYRSMSKRDLFHLVIKDNKTKLQKRIFYVIKYLFLFPLLVFIWFAGMTIILFFLSKAQSVETILLMSMALISAARITAYYKEELSQEIGKILPLAVLGIFMVDPTFFSLPLTISRFYELPSLAVLLVNYFLFTIVLEFVLRVLLTIKRRVSTRK